MLIHTATTIRSVIVYDYNMESATKSCTLMGAVGFTRYKELGANAIRSFVRYFPQWCAQEEQIHCS
jgi:hypothetical protein